MKHLSMVIAVLVIAAALALPRGTEQAEAQEAPEGELTGNLAPVGISLVVWSGGNADAVVGVVTAAGCNLTSFWANAAAGGFVGYFQTDIQLVNQPFLTDYPDGELPANTPLIVVCREGGTPVTPPTTMAELPDSPITAVLDQTYKVGPGGTQLTFSQAEFPLEAGAVTARWYTANGFYVVGYDGVDLSASGPLCPGNSIATATGFQFVTNDPTDDASGICGSAGFANLAGPSAGVQACGDLLVYITEIPTTTSGTLFGTIEVISADETVIGMTSTVESDLGTTPEIDLESLCGAAA